MHSNKENFAQGRADIVGLAHKAIAVNPDHGDSLSAQPLQQANYFIRLQIHLRHAASLENLSPENKVILDAVEKKRQNSFDPMIVFFRAAAGMTPDDVVSQEMEKFAKKTKEQFGFDPMEGSQSEVALAAGRIYEANGLAAMMSKIGRGEKPNAIPNAEDKGVERFIYDLVLESHRLDIREARALHASIAQQTELSDIQKKGLELARYYFHDLEQASRGKEGVFKGTLESLSPLYMSAAAAYPSRDWEFAQSKADPFFKHMYTRVGGPVMLGSD